MRFASTFLSHSSADKTLVRAVAGELGRRGVVPWLDINMLHAGVSLSEALTKAIEDQVSVTLFLSPASVKSDWVHRELAHALQLERDHPQLKNWIIPIFMGDALELVRAQPLLQHWLDGRGEHVDRLGITVAPPAAGRIAAEIARSIYALMGLEQAAELAVLIDQRGRGSRVGWPDVSGFTGPESLPALVFRPDMEQRSNGEVFDGDRWVSLAKSFKDSLGLTLQRHNKVHMLGESQLAWSFLFGHLFDRTMKGHLVLHHLRFKQEFALDLAPYLQGLDSGDPYCHTLDLVSDLKPGEQHSELSLLLISDRAQALDALRHVQASGGPPPVHVWTSKKYEMVDQVLDLIQNVTALLRRLREEHGTRRIRLYTSLPFHVLPLLAALLVHVVKVTFMEFKRDAEGTDLYAPLDFPPQ